MIWKLLPTLLSGIALLLIGLLDYKWFDKRTTKFKQTRQVFFIVLSLLLLSSVASVFRDYESAKEQAREQARKTEEQTRRAEEQTRRAEEQTRKLSTVLLEIQSLRSMLDPFVKEASARFPDESQATALQRLSRDIRQVRELATREVRKEPTVSVQAQTATALKIWSKAYPRVTLASHVYNTSFPNVERSVGDIEALIRDASILLHRERTVGFISVVGGPGPLRGFVLISAPSNQSAAEHLAKALGNLVEGIKTASDASLPPSVIVIQVNGAPRYTTEGRVSFE